VRKAEGEEPRRGRTWRADDRERALANAADGDPVTGLCSVRLLEVDSVTVGFEQLFDGALTADDMELGCFCRDTHTRG
jgi:hypothetical protein